jgi:transcriptional regulator with XRE-family HTH domain
MLLNIAKWQCRTGEAVLKVRVEALKSVMAERGWGERQLAEALGVDHSHVNRVLHRKRQPGPKFIAGVIRLGLRFEDIFCDDGSR